jgi:hypothetical protein
MHIRLLVTGALVALFLFALGARVHGNDLARDTEVPRVLHITVIATSKTKPRFEAYNAWLPYPTLYTCQEASTRIDLELIGQIVAHKQHVNVLSVSMECMAAGSLI